MWQKDTSIVKSSEIYHIHGLEVQEKNHISVEVLLWRVKYLFLKLVSHKNYLRRRVSKMLKVEISNTMKHNNLIKTVWALNQIILIMFQKGNE